MYTLLEDNIVDFLGNKRESVYIRVFGDAITNISLDSLLVKVPDLISFNYDTKLATIARKKDGVEAKPLEISLAKYLKKLGMSTSLIEEVNTNINKAVLFKKSQLLFTNSAEEAMMVYKNGPQSCMKRRYESAAVYSTEDVCVAYLAYQEKILARAVVNKKDKQFNYLYGCAITKKHLISCLKKEGYVDTWKCLDGARIALIRGSDDRIVMPFIDGSYCFVNEPEEGDTMLTIQHDGDYECQSTSGYLNTECCPACGCNVDDDEEPVTTREGTECCTGCVSGNYTYVESLGEYVHDYDVVYCQNTETNELMEDCSEMWDGDWALDSDCVELTAGEYEGEFALVDDTETIWNHKIALAGECEEITSGKYEGKWALQEDLTPVPDGGLALVGFCVVGEDGELCLPSDIDDDEEEDDEE